MFCSVFALTIGNQTPSRSRSSTQCNAQTDVLIRSAKRQLSLFLMQSAKNGKSFCKENIDARRLPPDCPQFILSYECHLNDGIYRGNDACYVFSAHVVHRIGLFRRYRYIPSFASEHFDHVEKVLLPIWRAKVILKLRKCVLMQALDYPGHATHWRHLEIAFQVKMKSSVRKFQVMCPSWSPSVVQQLLPYFASCASS